MQINKSCFYKVALITITAIFLNACESDNTESQNNKAPAVQAVKLLVVGQSGNDSYLNYPAVIKSRQLSELSFEVSGVVRELNVVAAQEVKEGQILAKLDQRDLLSERDSAQSKYDNADAEYQRALRLIQNDAISRSVLEQRESARAVSKALLMSAEKAVQDSILRAPYAGNIATVLIQKEQSIQAGSSAISILGKQGLEASINIPSRIVALASGKPETESDSDVYLTLDIAPDRQIPVKFKEASLEADVVSQTYEITFSFEPIEGLNILPGMNASVWFKNPSDKLSKAAGPQVPLTAVMTEGSQKYVWVVDENTNEVKRRNITFKEDVGAYLTVSSGLEAGEAIVAAGVSALSEGMKVRPWSE